MALRIQPPTGTWSTFIVASLDDSFEALFAMGTSRYSDRELFYIEMQEFIDQFLPADRALSCCSLARNCSAVICTGSPDPLSCITAKER